MMKNIEEVFTPFACYPIDWELTPEDAVAMYLEWGNNWGNSRRAVTSKNDESFYFILDTWGNTPIIQLIKRTFDDAEVLAESSVPEQFFSDIDKEFGMLKGVFALPQFLRKFLQRALGE